MSSPGHDFICWLNDEPWTKVKLPSAKEYIVIRDRLDAMSRFHRWLSWRLRKKRERLKYALCRETVDAYFGRLRNDAESGL